MNVNSRGHNLDTRFEQLFSKIKHPPGPKTPVGVPFSSNRIKEHLNILARSRGAGHHRPRGERSHVCLEHAQHV
jgi:hypothetical protein